MSKEIYTGWHLQCYFQNLNRNATSAKSACAIPASPFAWMYGLYLSGQPRFPVFLLQVPGVLVPFLHHLLHQCMGFASLFNPDSQFLYFTFSFPL
jgi:hypothetical protein